MTSSRCGAVPPSPIRAQSTCVLHGATHTTHRSMDGEEWQGDFRARLNPITEIRINEHGEEEHESWLLVRANRVRSGPPGRALFDSEIRHQHFIRVTISQGSRKRDLNHDWHHAVRQLMEFDMSEAQWGAFVSSFGNGTGVPATLSWFRSCDLPDGQTPQSPFAGRLSESHAEVKQAATHALDEIQQAYDELQQAFDDKAGRKVMGEKLRKLQNRMGNAPANMEHAAKSLTKHVENVVTKARADVEGMVLMAQQSGIQLEAANMPLIEASPEST